MKSCTRLAWDSLTLVEVKVDIAKDFLIGRRHVSDERLESALEKIKEAEKEIKKARSFLILERSDRNRMKKKERKSK